MHLYSVRSSETAALTLSKNSIKTRVLALVALSWSNIRTWVNIAKADTIHDIKRETTQYML